MKYKNPVIIGTPVVSARNPVDAEAFLPPLTLYRFDNEEAYPDIYVSSRGMHKVLAPAHKAAFTSAPGDRPCRWNSTFDCRLWWAAVRKEFPDVEITWGHGRVYLEV